MFRGVKIPRPSFTHPRLPRTDVGTGYVAPEQVPTTTSDLLEQLTQALTELDRYSDELLVAPSAIVNALLNVWDAAHAIDQSISEPIEQMLTVTVHRMTIDGREVAALVDEVRARALEVSLLCQAFA
ncbi:MAG: hypothetical protein M0Z30_12105 [Actinomycetota bacterium]|nr:hypothetical protein [Actinomycetota bacterium]